MILQVASETCWHREMTNSPLPSSEHDSTPRTIGQSRVSAEDKAEAAELLARYAEFIDAGDFEGLAELLADAELLDESGNRIAKGKAEMLALYSAMTLRHADGTPLTAHVITNVIVESAGPDEWQMRSRFTVFQATDSLPLQPVVVGRYVDTLRRIDGSLRFTARVMMPQAWGDVTQHLSFDPR
jgi:3-phenylpropionate/cinnamic acid dioxygenase small subunit